MNDRYRLGALGNEQLLAALKGLVRRESFALADMLAHLAELDERKLFLDLGYSSLFAYCTEALRFCKSSAGRRIAAARVCRRYPEAFSQVAKGELQLSVLSVLGPHLNASNAAELFDACSGNSFEQVEELLATRFPRPDVRDSIRRLPDAARRTPDIGSENGLSVTAREAQEKPAAEQSITAERSTRAERSTSANRETTAEATPIAAEEASSRAQLPTQLAAQAIGQWRPAAERIEPLSPGRFGVHFTADGEFRELLEEVQALVSHQQPRGELLPVMKRALEAYRRELQKRRFAVGAKPRPGSVFTAVRSDLCSETTRPGFASAAVRPATRTRRVPAAVRRAVYERDHGVCTFVAGDGRRCGERKFLELDHVRPWARRGASTVGNLRLRCRAHNHHAARVVFGNAHMQTAVARAQSMRREQRTPSGCATSGPSPSPESSG